MIPTEVAKIAELIAADFDDQGFEEEYYDLAWTIYRSLGLDK